MIVGARRLSVQGVMTATVIMVDELRLWRIARAAPRCFSDGSCHLTCEGDIEVLHAFAARLGLRREWFQDHPRHPHYDLTRSKRRRAVQLGAVEVRAKEQARHRCFGPTDHAAESEVVRWLTAAEHG